MVLFGLVLVDCIWQTHLALVTNPHRNFGRPCHSSVKPSNIWEGAVAICSFFTSTSSSGPLSGVRSARARASWYVRQWERGRFREMRECCPNHLIEEAPSFDQNYSKLSTRKPKSFFLQNKTWGISFVIGFVYEDHCPPTNSWAMVKVVDPIIRKRKLRVRSTPPDRGGIEDWWSKWIPSAEKDGINILSVIPR